jgi:hypothetical protein
VSLPRERVIGRSRGLDADFEAAASGKAGLAEAFDRTNHIVGGSWTIGRNDGSPMPQGASQRSSATSYRSATSMTALIAAIIDFLAGIAAGPLRPWLHR